MRAIVVVLLALAQPAAAEVLRMRQFDSTNLHIANNAGAIHWNEDITITVTLGAKGRADVVSKGTRSEHNLHVINNANYNTDDTNTWTTTWIGTWKMAKGSLALDLALVKETCTAVRDDEGTKTAKKCKPVSKRAVIACTATMVEVGDKKRKVAAWRCAPDAASELGESPVSWVLGKDRCIEVNGGHMMPLSFAPCP